MSNQNEESCDCVYCQTHDITGPVDIVFDSNTSGLVVVWPKSRCRMELTLGGAFELSSALAEALMAAETIMTNDAGGIN